MFCRDFHGKTETRTQQHPCGGGNAWGFELILRGVYAARAVGQRSPALCVVVGLPAPACGSVLPRGGWPRALGETPCCLRACSLADLYRT